MFISENSSLFIHTQPLKAPISTNEFSTLISIHFHRRTGNFLPGGAVNHFPKKLLQVAQIFTKQSNRNEGHTMQQHRPY